MGGMMFRAKDHFVQYVVPLRDLLRKRDQLFNFVQLQGLH